MLLPLIAAVVALNLQAQAAPDHRRTTVRDSTADSSATPSKRPRHTRRAVTEELRNSAFKDATARKLVLDARTARMRQDSALRAYDAMSYQRISVGMNLTALARNRLLFRHESASRIRWVDTIGAWVDVKGARTATPMFGSAANDDARDEIRSETSDPDLMGAIPYFPGYEPLWVGSDIARAQVDDRELVNPIAEGAEAYYTYESGDSVIFRLPDKTVVQLREIRVRPRQPKWNLAVGSLWFDTRSGQVVRAAYRLSVPMDIWEVAKEDDSTADKDVPKWAMAMMSPMRAEITAIGIEYGLYNNRFWLPRLRVAEGSAQVSFMHLPIKMEESFKYASVNGKDSLPPIKAGMTANALHVPDSLKGDDREAWIDSARTANREKARVLRRAQNDSIRRGLLAKQSRHASPCDTTDTRTSAFDRYESHLKVAMRVPCDVSKLESSPDLPASIYDKNDELFDEKDLDALKAEALSLSAQAPFSMRMQLWPPPTITYGPSMLRYNRVEGLSIGASVEQQMGGGYSALAVGRLGFADLEPNVELGATRSNMTESIGLRAYNHLVSASDWGHPLTFGSSFSALLFGRDEGFYYRATGIELNGGRATPFGGARITWRAFAEGERSAAVKATFAVNGSDFPANLIARRATYEGIAARINHDYGLDPMGLRTFTDFRVEAAHGDSVYGRAALDFTITHGLGPLAGALTVSGGSSVGSLPPQRLWYLGGSQTIRGQRPDTAQSGNAFWITRAELGTAGAGMRPTIFADLGWVGDRRKMNQVGRPMSGAGAGTSFMDGLFRFDVARGVYPRKQWRVDLYLESKF